MTLVPYFFQPIYIVCLVEIYCRAKHNMLIMLSVLSPVANITVLYNKLQASYVLELCNRSDSLHVVHIVRSVLY